MKDRLVTKALSCSAWAMLPSAFKQLCQIVGRHASGQPIPEAALEAVNRAKAAAAAEPQPEDDAPFVRVGSTAVIPIRGTLIRRADAFDRVSGATDPEDLRATFRAALADAQVARIVLDIDSPGGSVDGINEFAEEIRAGREQKPVIAVANSMAASAAFWLGAQASEFYVSSGGMVGSIGVIRMDMDPRKAWEAMGVDLETVTSAELKNARTLNQDKTVAQVLASTQDLQQWHSLFVDAVAAGRGIDREKAEGLADGRVAVGRAAVTEGFVDGVRSLEQILDSETSNEEDRMAVKTKGGEAASRTPAPAKAEETVEVTVTESQTEEDDEEEDDEEEEEEEGKAEAKPAASRTSKGRRSNAKTYDRGVAAERERQKAIRGMACAGQEDLAEQLVDDGATVAEARVQLHDDLRTRAGSREQQRADDYAPLTTAADRQAAARAAADGTAGEPKPKDAIEAAARRKWAANPRLKEIFGTFDFYMVEQRAIAEGTIRSNLPSEN